MNEVEVIKPGSVPVIHTETGNILAAIVEVAKDKEIDIGRINALMDVKERIEGAEAKRLFAMDFALMKPELPRVVRTKDNQQTKSKYAPLEEINKEIDPVLAKYGFATAAKIVSQTETSVTVKAELWHRAGHVEETILTMPIDNKGMAGSVNKTMVHGIASTITYIKRVAICALLNISTGDDSDGNHESDVLTMDQAAFIDNKLNDLNLDKNVFLTIFGVDDVRNIPAKRHDEALKRLAKREADLKKEQVK